MSFSTRVASGLLTSRIDAGFYAPHHIERERRLRVLGVSRPALGDHAELITDGAHKTPSYVASGVRFLSATNIVDGALSFSGHRWITEQEFKQLQAWKCAPLAGDVLVAKSGTIGGSAVVPARIEPFAVFESIAIVRVARFDSYYLSAFLNSAAGRAEIERHTKGSVIHHLHLEDLRCVEVPEFGRAAQCYIGSKVRQAEALRERARAAEVSFQQEVAVECPPAAVAVRSQRVAFGALDHDLHPGRFMPDRMQVRRVLGEHGAKRLSELATIAALNTTSPGRTRPYVGLDGISSNSIDIDLRTVGDAQVEGACRILRPGPVISRLRPYLNKVALIPDEMTEVVGSTELLCVVPSVVHPAYLYGVLKLESTLRQLRPLSSGATHPRVDADDVLDLLVPWRSDNETLGIGLARAQRQYLTARSLVTAARLLVEALIERKLTQSDLETAASDPETDRALLSRLTIKGLDGDGDPLFPDLDNLQSLVAEATAKDTA